MWWGTISNGLYKKNKNYKKNIPVAIWAKINAIKCKEALQN